ncbi:MULTISPECIES: hypothetical protein [Brachybacterium]|uniref:Uncharacterized protein n=1 Tax=Brachybacterium kimchii TaxID=2942909 RepID=A0ABY4N7R3_9MICO|nr:MULTISPECIES: hypothetical protein [Brachybacterium]MCG7308037.1 hypothetical protein [Brachybacterium sp. ACRRE]UQN30598.1 hypothetical protein M4486_04600 [Brachybacterium kimchii]
MIIENEDQAARMAIRTPSFDAHFIISYEYRGPSYMQEQFVDSFECAADECRNTWRADGTPWEIQSTVPDETGYRPFFFFDESGH